MAYGCWRRAAEHGEGWLIGFRACFRSRMAASRGSIPHFRRQTAAQSRTHRELFAVWHGRRRGAEEISVPSVRERSRRGSETRQECPKGRGRGSEKVLPSLPSRLPLSRQQLAVRSSFLSRYPQPAALAPFASCRRPGRNRLATPTIAPTLQANSPPLRPRPRLPWESSSRPSTSTISTSHPKTSPARPRLAMSGQSPRTAGLTRRGLTRPS